MLSFSKAGNLKVAYNRYWAEFFYRSNEQLRPIWERESSNTMTIFMTIMIRVISNFLSILHFPFQESPFVLTSLRNYNYIFHQSPSTKTGTIIQTKTKNNPSDNQLQPCSPLKSNSAQSSIIS